MFGNKNIGAGTKVLAKILFFVLAIGSLAGGIVMLVYNNMWGIALIIGGIIGSYLICYLIHALGYLIEKTESKEEVEERHEKTMERDNSEADQIPAGFTKVDIDGKGEIDALIKLKQEGKITEEEYNERFKALLNK